MKGIKAIFLSCPIAVNYKTFDCTRKDWVSGWKPGCGWWTDWEILPNSEAPGFLWPRVNKTCFWQPHRVFNFTIKKVFYQRSREDRKREITELVKFAGMGTLVEFQCSIFCSYSMASVVFCSFISPLGLYSKKNMVMGPYAGVDFNSPYLIINPVVLFCGDGDFVGFQSSIFAHTV